MKPLLLVLILILTAVARSNAEEESCRTDNDCEGGFICFHKCIRLSKLRSCYNWYQCGLIPAYRCLWGFCVPRGYVPKSSTSDGEFYYDLTI